MNRINNSNSSFFIEFFSSLFIYMQIIISFALFINICKSILFLFFYANKAKMPGKTQCFTFLLRQALIALIPEQLLVAAMPARCVWSVRHLPHLLSLKKFFQSVAISV